MAGLKEQAIWESEIYQIEENDPVHGGEDGITNKPAKQLANRTLYLRNLLTLAGQKIVPKTITATSTNTADETGHTHAIDHATTGQKGIVQLTNDTGLDSEALALTAKAGKKLAQEIAQNRQKTVELANQKVNKSDVSDAVNSTSQTQVASSRGLKTAHDKALQAERLAQLYSADVSEYIDCNQAMEGMFTTRVGTPDGEICYVLNLKYKHSNSRGQIAISYWDTNPKIWIRNKYDTEPHFSAWKRVDGADWDDIRNKVNASLTKYGLAQYRDDINLDSSDFAATPKAVKSLNDKKQDKLVQQTIDLTQRDPNKWYPIILNMPDVRKMFKFAVRRTLGDGNNPPWGTHGDGFTTYCEWETQPSSWGAYPYQESMRLIRQFTFAYAHQSPVLKIGQIHQASWEYVYLRGGTSYTISREADVVVDIGVDGYRWQSGSYSANLPIIESYDESLVPKTYRTALSTVSRRDYSRTVRGTNANWDNGTSKSIAVTGSVEIYPDGKIVQYFYYRNFRVHWFDYEVAPSEHFRVPEIPIQLWTAMPNKITYVSGHISRTNDTSIWPVRSAGAEATEWTPPLWAFEKQGNLKDRCNVYTRRLAGDTNETVDMLIRVEGY